jgi:hypothetical protein
MSRTWQAIVVMALAGCGGRATGGDSDRGTGESGSNGTDTGEPLSELCEAALDPATYVDGPVFTPTFPSATAECPAYSGKLVIDLPSPVQVTGTVTVAGIPTPATVLMTGRNGEGTATQATEDGSFTFRLWPGHYDVSAWPWDRDLTQRVDVLTDVDLTSPAELLLELPPAVILSGTMTMDGEPPSDPYGYLWLSTVADSTDEAMLYMPDGSYELQVSPGTYEVSYFWCDHTQVHPRDGGSRCSNFDGPPIPEGTQIVGPLQQEPVAFDSIDIAVDTVLAIDVPTARVTGIVEFDGAPPEDDVELWVKPEGNYNADRFRLEEDGSFDIRLVRGLYQSSLARDGRGLVPELGLIDGDLDVEILRESVLLTATAPPLLPVADDWLALLLTEIGTEWTTDLTWTPGEPLLEQLLWPHVSELAIRGKYCWPDDPHDSDRVITTVLESAREFEGVVPLELDVPFAAVHIELHENGVNLRQTSNGDMILQLTAEGDPPRGTELEFRRHSDESGIDVHGYLAPGRYRVTYGHGLIGTFDMTDGTTLQVDIAARPIQLEFSVDGMPLGLGSAASMVELVNLDTQWTDLYSEYDIESRSFAPGRYELRYVGWDELLPENQDVVVGCVTIEN